MTKKSDFICHHGMAKAKGCTHVAVGKFSRLFPDLKSLALSEEEAAAIGGPGGVMHDFDDTSPDGPIPAGYIFFAQFVDHDITFDTTSDLRGAPKDADAVAKLPNLRSASLDLDAVYGFGPEGSPHLYDPARHDRLAVHENGYDLARSPGGVALIGDPRNDENIFISQLHLMFHRLHNRLHDERVSQTDIAETGWSRFAAAQRETRYHYQWVVLFDFLKRLCDPDIFAFAAPMICDPDAKFPFCYGLDAHHQLPMPVEFSTAAFRVGHTMVRQTYALNADNTDVHLFDERFGTTGFSAVPEHLAIDWRYMLPIDPHLAPRMAKAIDPALADQLHDLPIVGSRNANNRSLAFRNIMRANALGVPSGQAVAEALKAKGYPLDVCDLKLDEVKPWKRVGAVLHKSGTDLAKHTPLFYYLLRESELKSGGRHFGPAGSALLLEVFGGMLKLCADTFVQHPDWRPDVCVASGEAPIDKDRAAGDADYFPLTLSDLVRFAGRL
jgi:hypothetical protein